MWKFGVRYLNGKILFFKTKQVNPEVLFAQPPAWAVDIREILAIVFVGSGALCLVLKGEYAYGVALLSGLLGYVTGRTVPGGK